MAVKLLSPSILQRSPGKRQVTSREASQITYLTKKMATLKNKLKKKKHGKKRACDLSDSDSDSH